MKNAICCFALIFVSFVIQAQTPDYITQLQVQWQLQSVTRNDGTIIYYDWNASKALNVSPVLWAFSNGIGAILNDTTATPDKLPTDTVEASHYAIKGDTLILNNYFTKGEAETATNMPVAYYQIAKIDNDNLLLILYDTVYGKFRPSDQYSKRYVFKRVEQSVVLCANEVLKRFSTLASPTNATDSLNMINGIMSGLDSCINAAKADTFNCVLALGNKADIYFKIKNYEQAAKNFLILIPLYEGFLKPRGGDKTGGRVTAEFYYKLSFSQIKTGQNQQGCLNLKKAIEIRPNDKYSEELKKLCN